MQSHMKRNPNVTMLCVIALLSVACGVARALPDTPAVRTSHVTIVIDSGDDGIEQRVAEVLRDRILRRSQVTVDIASAVGDASVFHIYLGRRDAGSGRFKEIVERHRVTLPGKARIAPEGYAVKLVQSGEGPLLIAEGADVRGVLYAAGEVLRQFDYGSDWVSIAPVDMTAAPAYRFRGSSANQGGTMRERTGARAWTQE